jgi:endoglucanase
MRFLQKVSWILTSAMIMGRSRAKIIYAGVNSGTKTIQIQNYNRKGDTDRHIAGGEFAQQNLPGTFGIDYQFINETAIDFFLDAGVNAIRLPFLLVHLSFCTFYFRITNNHHRNACAP